MANSSDNSLIPNPKNNGNIIDFYRYSINKSKSDFPANRCEYGFVQHFGLHNRKREIKFFPNWIIQKKILNKWKKDDEVILSLLLIDLRQFDFHLDGVSRLLSWNHFMMRFLFLSGKYSMWDAKQKITPAYAVRWFIRDD